MADRLGPVVAIGASAGGLQALEMFFGAVPAQSGLSVVVLTHLAPNRDSHLALIRREIEHDLGGRVTLRFAPDGLQALFRLPFEPKLFRAGRVGRG